MLLRPSPQSPRIPKGVPVEVAVVSLSDERGVRAALRGVDHVYHLASAESQGRKGNLFATDIEGTRTLARAAKDANIQRLIFISHIGADRASAFPIQKAKGIAEEHIRQSGVPYTIIRSSVLFGPEDRFTNTLVNFMRDHALHLSDPQRWTLSDAAPVGGGSGHLPGLGPGKSRDGQFHLRGRRRGVFHTAPGAADT